MSTLGRLLVLALSSSLAACVAADSTSDVVAETAGAASEDFVDADVVEVQPDRIVYPAHVARTKRVLDLIAQGSRAAPTFLIGDRSAKAANGYLRRVVSVSTAPNGDVVFVTEKASLTEAREELARQGFVKLDGDGCFPHTVNPFSLFHVDLSRSLYDKSFGSIGRMKIALANSFLTVDGNLETQVSGACLAPDSAQALLNVNLRGQVVLEGSFDGAFGAATGEIDLFHERVEITSVLGFPLALDFAVTGECDFASTGKVLARVGGKVDARLQGGAAWTSGGGFSTSFTPTWPQPSVVGPTFSTNANVSAKCTVKAKALALVFDSDEGPRAEASSYLNLEAMGSGSGAGGSVRAKLVAGVDAGIGGTLKPFHITLVEQIRGPAFHREWTLFDRSFAVGH